MNLLGQYSSPPDRTWKSCEIFPIARCGNHLRTAPDAELDVWQDFQKAMQESSPEESILRTRWLKQLRQLAREEFDDDVELVVD